MPLTTWPRKMATLGQNTDSGQKLEAAVSRSELLEWSLDFRMSLLRFNWDPPATKMLVASESIQTVWKQSTACFPFE